MPRTKATVVTEPLLLGSIHTSGGDQIKIYTNKQNNLFVVRSMKIKKMKR